MITFRKRIEIHIVISHESIACRLNCHSLYLSAFRVWNDLGVFVIELGLVGAEESSQVLVGAEFLGLLLIVVAKALPATPPALDCPVLSACIGIRKEA